MTDQDQLTVNAYLTHRIALAEAQPAFIRWAAWLDSTGRGVPQWLRDLAAGVEA